MFKGIEVEPKKSTQRKTKMVWQKERRETIMRDIDLTKIEMMFTIDWY